MHSPLNVKFVIRWPAFHYDEQMSTVFITSDAIRTITTYLHSKYSVEERTGSRNANEIAPHHLIYNPLIAFYLSLPCQICIPLTGTVWWYFIPNIQKISCCIFKKKNRAGLRVKTLTVRSEWQISTFECFKSRKRRQ